MVRLFISRYCFFWPKSDLIEKEQKKGVFSLEFTLLKHGKIHNSKRLVYKKQKQYLDLKGTLV